MTNWLLIVITIELGLLICLQYKHLPAETKQELLRAKPYTPSTKVFKYIPPKEEDEATEMNIRESLRL